jgi:hypothetical protein
VTALEKVVVFGGTAFLGRRVAQHLLDHGRGVANIGDDRSVVAAAVYGPRISQETGTRRFSRIRRLTAGQTIGLVVGALASEFTFGIYLLSCYV